MEGPDETESEFFVSKKNDEEVEDGLVENQNESEGLLDKKKDLRCHFDLCSNAPWIEDHHRVGYQEEEEVR